MVNLSGAETAAILAVSAAGAVCLLLAASSAWKRARSRTPGRETLARSFMNTSPSLMVALDELGRVFMVNQAFLDRLGYAEDEALGRDFIPMFVPERDAGHTAGNIDHALSSMEMVTFDGALRTMDGQEVHMTWRARALPAKHRRTVLLAGIDITDYQRAQEALASSERRYRLYAENVRDVLWVLDTDLRYVYISPSVFQLRGYTQEEALSLPMEKVFTRDSLFNLLKAVGNVESMLASGKTFDPQATLKLELEQYCKDGTTRWTEIIANLLLDDTGKHIGFLGITRDITDRKNAQESLRLSEERYRTIFETTGTATIIVREDTVVSLANSEFERLSGYPKEAVEGTMSWKDFVMEEDLGRVIAYHDARGRDPSSVPRSYEFRFKDRFGHIRNVIANATLIPGTTMSVVSLLDITERMEAEERLRISREQLRNLHRHTQELRESERASVAREIHDELGQVLTALKMDLSYLGRRLEPSQETLRAKVAAMGRSIDASIDAVRKIIMELRPGILDHLGLVPAIEWQAQEFQERTGIRCRLNVSSQEVPLDRDVSITVFRIFQEALTNVARHAHATEVEVSLVASGQTVSLTIHDDGKGITRNELEDERAFGIMGMRERAFFCNGSCDIYTDDRRGGTTVELRIPIAGARVADDTGTSRG